MTTNALLVYLGIALTFSAAIFLFLGIRHPGSDYSDIVQAHRELQQENLVLLTARYANIVCAALLLVVALTAELVSLARGGPTYGDRSGNVSGAIVAIALATFVCLIGCLAFDNEDSQLHELTRCCESEVATVDR